MAEVSVGPVGLGACAFARTCTRTRVCVVGPLKEIALEMGKKEQVKPAEGLSGLLDRDCIEFDFGSLIPKRSSSSRGSSRVAAVIFF